MKTEKIDLLLELMKSWFEKIDAKFEAIDQKFEAKFEAMDQKFEAMDKKFDDFKIETRNNFYLLNQRMDMAHDDYKDIKKQNEKIEEELVKPIQRKTSIKYIEFTSIWWFISLMIAIVASLISVWIAHATFL